MLVRKLIFFKQRIRYMTFCFLRRLVTTEDTGHATFPVAKHSTLSLRHLLRWTGSRVGMLSIFKTTVAFFKCSVWERVSRPCHWRYGSEWRGTPFFIAYTRSCLFLFFLWDIIHITNSFKVYNSVVFSIFTKLCNHFHYLIQEYIHQETLHSLAVTLLFSLLPAPGNH